jgi:hypothetical protein
MAYLYLLMVVLQVFRPANPSASWWSSCGQWRLLSYACYYCLSYVSSCYVPSFPSLWFIRFHQWISLLPPFLFSFSVSLCTQFLPTPSLSVSQLHYSYCHLVLPFGCCYAIFSILAICHALCLMMLHKTIIPLSLCTYKVNNLFLDLMKVTAVKANEWLYMQWKFWKCLSLLFQPLMFYLRDTVWMLLLLCSFCCSVYSIAIILKFMCHSHLIPFPAYSLPHLCLIPL